MADEDERANSITTTVELVGEYEEIAAILGREADAVDELAPVVADVETVLDVVERTGGVTKGRLAEEMPSDVTADLDAEAVIHVLRVLELYDLVSLDGNTWRPGPALSTD